MIDAADVRAYVNADPDLPSEDALLLTTLTQAAIEWFANAGIPEDTAGELYKLGVKMLVASWFSTRGDATGVQLHSVPHGVYAIKQQLYAVSLLQGE